MSKFILHIFKKLSETLLCIKLDSIKPGKKVLIPFSFKVFKVFSSKCSLRMSTGS